MHIPFFHQNNSPLEQAKLEQDPNITQIAKPNHTKKIIIISAIILFIILNIGLLIATGIIPSQNLPFVQKPTPTPKPDVLLATVGDQKIYLSQIETIAKEQYEPSAIDKKVIASFLNTAIERAILDQEAKKLNLTITNQDIDAYLQPRQPNQINNKIVRENTKYKLIKDTIITRFVTSVNANTISFWVPPYNYPTGKNFEQQRILGKQALEEAKKSIDNGQSALSAAKQIYNKYKILQPILAFNGYLLSKVTNDALLETPKTYTKGQTDYDDALFSGKLNEVKIIIPTDGSGATLIQIVGINNGASSNYDTWYNNRKKALVKTFNN